MKRMLVLSVIACVASASIAADAPTKQSAPTATPASRAENAETHSQRVKKRHTVRRGGSGSALAVASANRAATIEPTPNGFVNAAQVYPYAEGMVFKIYTAPGRVTDIALQPGETLVAVASGDTVRWVIGDTTSGSGPDRRIHVLVKPFSAGLATNLVITTDRRSYHVALISTGSAAMAALSWTYPQDALIALKRTQAQAAAIEPVAAGLEIGDLHFDYAISGGKPAWRPLRAFDDGRQTFIEFPATLAVGEAPPLFLVDRKGEAQLVNYRLRGRFFVVDRLFDMAELRLGTKDQEVVRISRTPAIDDRMGS